MKQPPEKSCTALTSLSIGCRNVTKNHWHRRQSDHCCRALKLGLKAKQMDVVMGIVSECDVLIKRCGKSLLWSPALHL